MDYEKTALDELAEKLTEVFQKHLDTLSFEERQEKKLALNRLARKAERRKQYCA